MKMFNNYNKSFDMNPMKNLQKRAEKAIANEKGDQNLGSAIQILIAVVIGALLLAGLYTLFDEVVLPTVTDRVQGMFDYSG